jgi:hypothetical protein
MAGIVQKGTKARIIVRETQYTPQCHFTLKSAPCMGNCLEFVLRPLLISFGAVWTGELGAREGGFRPTIRPLWSFYSMDGKPLT